MGVPGLWDLIRPAAQRTSLSALAKTAFEANRNGLRAFTIGIDASLWIFHARDQSSGENPFLRTIFFKTSALLQQPVLPVFVFDGPKKPAMKRGAYVGSQFGSADKQSREFKALLDSIGLEYWNAPGEAEAELAVMNRQGKIDAVLSDDVDAFLFGATCVLRNNSPTLSGAQASSTRNPSASTHRQYEVYRSADIQAAWAAKEGSKLQSEEECRMAMVFIALLGGGDYAPEGLPGFGGIITHGLACAGLSDFLKLYTTDRAAFDLELPFIPARMIAELQTNASKQIGRRYPDRASKLSSATPSSIFPTFALDAYLKPATSPLNDPSKGWQGFRKHRERGSLEGMALTVENSFEWGTKEIVVHRFGTSGVFGGEIVAETREEVRRKDLMAGLDAAPGSISRITSYFSSQSQAASSSSKGTSPLPSRTVKPSHLRKIHATRIDPTSPDITEYRLSFEPQTYIDRCHAVMRGTRVNPKDLPPAERQRLGLVNISLEESSSSQKEMIGKSELRVWIADYLVKAAWPHLVDAYEAELAEKAKPKAKPTKKGAQKGKGKANGEDAEKFKDFFCPNKPIIPRRLPSSHDPSDEGPAVEGDENENSTTPKGRSSVSSRTPTPLSPSTSRGNSPLSTLVSSQLSKPRRPYPTSSLSSLSDISPSHVSKSPTKKARPVRKTPTMASPSPYPDIIDLCSSDDEVSPVVKPPARSQSNTRDATSLLMANRGTLAVSTAPTKRATRTAKKQDAEAKQSMLDLQKVGPGRSATSKVVMEAKEVVEIAAPVLEVERRKERKEPWYKVVSCTSDEETIDVSMFRRATKGRN
ncbi:holliday junction resolvase GEN1/YEN1, partial [Tremellales sp. Uapishka_1]